MKKNQSGSGVKAANLAIAEKNEDLLLEVFQSKKISYVELVRLISESDLSLKEKAFMLWYCSSEFENSKQANEIAEAVWRKRASEIFESIKKENFKSWIKLIHSGKRSDIDMTTLRGTEESFLETEFTKEKQGFVWRIQQKLERIRENCKYNYPQNHRNEVHIAWGWAYSPEEFSQRKRYRHFRDVADKVEKKYRSEFKFDLGILGYGWEFFGASNAEQAYKMLNEMSNKQYKALIDSIEIDASKKYNSHLEKQNAIEKFKYETGLPASYFGAEPDLCAFIHSSTQPFVCKIKGLYIIGIETEGKDWNYYSKAWHRAHGPKRWIESRELQVYQPGKGQIASIPVERWGAKNIVEALAGYFKLQKQPCPKGRKPVQMNDYFTIRLDHRINGYEIYERLFADTHVDWCIFDTKTKNTYHSAKQEELVPGLRNKLQAKLDREFETITKATGFTLGFCETGMRNFCDDNDLDFDGEYSRRDMRNIVIKKRELNYRKYRSELAKIGITLSSK